MKELLFAALVLGCPLCGLALRRSGWALAALVFAVGFLPYFADVSFSMAVDVDYRGTDIGFRVSLLDVAAWTLLFATRSRRAPPAPYRLPFLVYGAVCVASLALAEHPLHGAYALWTLVRTGVLAVALSRALEERRCLVTLQHGLACGVIYAAGVCLMQRYVEGQHQTVGPLGHQNSSGIAAYVTACLMLARTLTAPGARLAPVALGAGALVVLLSLSRGCLTVLPLALGLTYAGALALRPTRRKLACGLAMVALSVPLVVRSLETVAGRFASAPVESAESRTAYEALAARMLDDHPLGVGLNQFAGMSAQSPYAGYATLLPGDQPDQQVIVHNMYWLTAAELGYLGLAAYLALLAAPIWRALVGAWRFRRDDRAVLLFAGFVALAAFALHGFLEWSARQERLLALFGIVITLVAVLARQLEADHRTARNGGRTCTM